MLESSTWELLALVERICQVFWQSEVSGGIGRTKEKGKKNAKANKNEKYTKKECCFADGNLEGRFLLGVFLPALSAFRCLINEEAFEQREFDGSEK